MTTILRTDSPGHLPVMRQRNRLACGNHTDSLPFRIVCVSRYLATFLYFFLLTNPPLAIKRTVLRSNPLSRAIFLIPIAEILFWVSASAPIFPLLYVPHL